MKVVKQGGKEYRLIFHYGRHGVKIDLPDGGIGIIMCRFVQAIFQVWQPAPPAPDDSRPGGWAPLTTGTATCKPPDVFTKEAGRQKALRHAYRNMVGGRSFSSKNPVPDEVIAARTLIMDYYQRQRGVPPVPAKLTPDNTAAMLRLLARLRHTFDIPPDWKPERALQRIEAAVVAIERRN